MEICAISDLHGYKPKLKSGDLLIVAGDCTGRDALKEWEEFYDWLRDLDFHMKILIGGNHDNFLQTIKNSDQARLMGKNDDMHQYLCDNSMNFLGYKIWGTPWTNRFHNQNPIAMAFSSWDSDFISEQFKKIPDDTEILITHSPSLGVLDYCSRSSRVGSPELEKELPRLKNLKLHLFGHIHECYGSQKVGDYMSYNCSHVNAYYENVNPPHYIKLPDKNENKEDLLQSDESSV